MDVSKRDNFYWAVRMEGVLAGFVGLHTVRYNRTQPAVKQFFVTFLIAKHMRGCGLGKRALEAAIENFHVLLPAVGRIYADIHEGNARSAAVLQRAGFAWAAAAGGNGRVRVQVGRKTLLRLQRVVSTAGDGEEDSERAAKRSRAR